MSKTRPWFTTERIVIGILILIIILLQQCSTCPLQEPIERVTTVIKRDTTVVIKRDTITRVVKLAVPPPLIYVTSDGDTMQTYVQEYSDSILDATMTATVKCKLDSWSFKYTPKIPVTITNTITNTVTVTKEVPVAKNMLFVNGVVLGNPKSFDAGLGISFYQKKGYIYQLNYLPITKTVMGGISIQLNR